jgi:hypothetical protein
MKNTMNIKNKPFYIFSENKNQEIKILHKSLCYESVAASIIDSSNHTENTTIIDFEASFKSLTLLLELLRHDTNIKELRSSTRNILESDTKLLTSYNKRGKWTFGARSLPPDQLIERINYNEALLAELDYHNADNIYKILDQPGIYMLTNRVNKKIYIGKATNLKQRLRSYIDVKSLTKTAPSSMIARSILKFGLENFSYTIIENCEKELLNKRERFYISSFKPQYNIRKPGPCDISYPL